MSEDRMTEMVKSADVVPIDPESTKPKNAFADRFKINDTGVWFKDEQDEWSFVSSPLNVTAITRDQYGQNFGRLLEWVDTDECSHQWAMPMEMLAGDGLDLRKQLLNGGLSHIGSHAKCKKLLMDFIATADVRTRAICVTKTGWHGDAFVLPDTVIGDQSQERVILQTAESARNHYREQGTLGEWQQQVSRYCVGNSRFTFAVSASFAAPLLELAGVDGIGVNFKGNSSEGKTTALRVAASVCGGSDYMNTWRATSNGLEGIAAHHNDSPLILDEMGQVSPKEAGEVSYMLSNGQGKQRASKSGAARAKKEWRVLWISSGEISLADHIGSVGQKAKAGQMVRLADIPMNTGPYGGFEELHGFKDGSELSDYLRVASQRYHGVAFRRYLEAIHNKRKAIAQSINTLQKDFMSQHVEAEASGQVTRVAGYFALVAAGGELATKSGITGWSQGSALDAAEICFKAWLQLRGGIQNTEDKLALEQITTFFQKHGQARFARWDDEGAEKVINRAGYIQQKDGETHYFVFPQVFRSEICKGHDHRQALKLLADNDLLVKEGGKLTVSRKPPCETGSVRFHCFKGGVIDG